MLGLSPVRASLASALHFPFLHEWRVSTIEGTETHFSQPVGESDLNSRRGGCTEKWSTTLKTARTQQRKNGSYNNHSLRHSVFLGSEFLWLLLFETVARIFNANNNSGWEGGDGKSGSNQFQEVPPCPCKSPDVGKTGYRVPWLISLMLKYWLIYHFLKDPFIPQTIMLKN